MHVMKASVDLSKCPVMSNVLVDLDFTLEIIWNRGLVHSSTANSLVQTFDETRNFSAALDSSECCASPCSSSDQLEAVKASVKFILLFEVWSKRMYGRVEISWPAAATPMTVETPHPLWQASRAALITCTWTGRLKSAMLKIWCAYISSAIKRIVESTVSDIDKIVLDFLAFWQCGGVDEISRA